MRVLHAAVFTDGQTLAGGLQNLEAFALALPLFPASSCSLVGCSHGAVALHVGLGVCCRVALRLDHSAPPQQRKQSQETKATFHGESLQTKKTLYDRV